MFHTVGFFVNTGATADTNVPPIQDSIITITNSHYLPQRNGKILYAVALGTLLLRAKMITPSWRQFTTPFIRPIIGTALTANDPNVADYRNNPLGFKALEEIQIAVTNSGAGPTDTSAFLGVEMSPSRPMPIGDIYTMRATSTTTAVVNTWTQIVMTWADTLPAGRYALVGMNHWSASGQSARAIFEEQSWRPGCISSNTAIQRSHLMFDKGGLGVWGEFDGNRMPNIEVCCGAADTAHEVFIDLVRIG